MNGMRKRLVIVLICAALVFCSAGGAGTPDARAASSDSGLITFSSQDDLIKALKHISAVSASMDNYFSRYYSVPDYALNEEVAAPPVVEAPSAVPTEADSTAKPEDYSQTNVQVQGVDEGDIVKTDGNYVYQVIENKIAIGRIYPVNEMNLTGEIDLSDLGISPSEIYVDGDRLVLVGSSSYYYYDYYRERSIVPPSSNFTMVMIYDISDRTSPKMIQEMDLEGYYMGSRKVDDVFYCVTNKSYWGFSESNLDSAVPHYRIGHNTEEYPMVPLENMGCFDAAISQNWINLGAINVKDPEQYKVSSYLGSGSNMYMSRQNLYIASTRDEIVWQKPVVDDQPGIITDIKGLETAVYKFALNDVSLDYKATGIVNGATLNQWSMDESDGYFRIATTNHDVNWWWWNDADTENDVYILDEDMGQRGALTGLAKGEKIYSTLFMGKRLYMVTFRQVDPFFVINLSNPSSPYVMGKLKIPGYSNYLYPYDENHIIGFGMETTDETGAVLTTGMKVGLFDVTDVSNPVQMSSVNIGDRGTTSELLNNHKALFYNRDNGLMAFPVTLMEVPNKDDEGSSTDWGVFTYQGAYFYKVDLVNGITFQYRLTHRSDKDYENNDYYYYGNDKDISRILYVNDIIYTVSNAYWMASELGSFKQLSLMTTEGELIKPPVDATSPNTTGGIRIIVNGVELQMDTPAIMENDRVLVPLRAIFEALGAQVNWNNLDNSILATYGIRTIRMVVGDNTAMLNGINVTMEVPPVMTGDRVLVPLRFVSESLGAVVNWDASNQTVTISN